MFNFTVSSILCHIIISANGLKMGNTVPTLPKLPFPSTLWNTNWLRVRRARETVGAAGAGLKPSCAFPLPPAINTHLQPCWVNSYANLNAKMHANSTNNKEYRFENVNKVKQTISDNMTSIFFFHLKIKLDFEQTASYYFGLCNNEHILPLGSVTARMSW